MLHRVTPDLLTLARDGAVRIPDVIPPSDLVGWRAHLARRMGASHALRSALDQLSALGPWAMHLVGDHLRAILGPGARPVRGLVFDKIPGRNWAVPWHQDLTVAVRERHEIPDFGPWTRKDGADHAHAPVALLERMVAVRIHLDDADEANGALRVIPGSHRRGVLAGPELQRLSRRGIDLPCRAGDLLLMRPLLAHASRPAVHPKHRRVIHLECAAEDLPGPLRWLECDR